MRPGLHVEPDGGDGGDDLSEAQAVEDGRLPCGDTDTGVEWVGIVCRREA